MVTDYSIGDKVVLPGGLVVVAVPLSDYEKELLQFRIDNYLQLLAGSKEQKTKSFLRLQIWQCKRQMKKDISFTTHTEMNEK